MKSGLQRFLLRLGLARLHLKLRDEPAALALLNEAINDIRGGDDSQKPYLILSAIEILASFDPGAATSRLGDAVKAFNASEVPRSGRFAANYSETVMVGDSSASFPLNISGLKFGNLVSTLKSLSSEPQSVRGVLFDLKDESILSEGMLAFANTLLG